MSKVKLSEDIKQSLLLVNKDNLISNDIFQQLLKLVINNLTQKNDDINFNSIHNSKPDILKEVFFSCLVLITEFSRHDLVKTDVEKYCTEILKYNKNKTSIVVNYYEDNKEQLTKQLKAVERHLPHIVDVNWKLEYIVKTSELDTVGGPIFKIQLSAMSYDEESQTNMLKHVNFNCNTLELIDLISKLKEITRHCEKIVTSL